MIELLAIVGLITLLIGGFTGCSVSDALGVAIVFAATVLFGGVTALAVMSILV